MTRSRDVAVRQLRTVIGHATPDTEGPTYTDEL